MGVQMRRIATVKELLYGEMVGVMLKDRINLFYSYPRRDELADL